MFINAAQHPAERRVKYQMVRAAGFSKVEADRMRDWPVPKLQQFLETHRPFNPQKTLHDFERGLDG